MKDEKDCSLRPLNRQALPQKPIRRVLAPRHRPQLTLRMLSLLAAQSVTNLRALNMNSVVFPMT